MEHKEGPGFTDLQPFRAVSRKRMKAIRNALKALEMAHRMRNGPRASKYADRLCDLAMGLQEHFHFMRKRACMYVRYDD